jgi:hypothetical protein
MTVVHRAHSTPSRRGASSSMAGEASSNVKLAAGRNAAIDAVSNPVPAPMSSTAVGRSAGNRRVATSMAVP